MADSWNALGSAVYSRLAPYVGSALYDAIAPGTVQPPFAVWQVLATNDEYSFSDDATETLDVQVKAISDRDWPDRARTLYGTIHTYMQDAPLSVTGYRVLRCRRMGSKFQYQDRDFFHHVGAIYRIEIVAV